MAGFSTRIIAPLAVAGMIVAAAPATAQVRTIDPNQAIDGDLAPDRSPARSADRAPAQSYPDNQTRPAPPYDPAPSYPDDAGPVTPPPARAPSPVNPDTATSPAEAATQAADTYQRDDLLAAAEGTFGKGAEGLAGLLEKILKEQGRPNAYIAGREAAGAFVIGLRYGSGVMTHKVEGVQPVYWTGPSVGFDFGGDANKVFVLVYNLYDSADLFHRFPGAEGRLYAVGGFAATYLRRGKVVLIPVRLGVGWRAGVNVGYMNFTHKSRLLPF